MDITHNANAAQGVFEAKKDTEFAGKLTYSKKGAIVTIEHTEVNPDFQGQGIGKKLVKKAADYAREHDFKVSAQCSYAKKLMERTSEYEDVLV